MYLVKYILLLLAFFAAPAISSSVNESTSVDTRNPRVTGRKGGWFPHRISVDIKCAGEGFHKDPKNCTVFYRCFIASGGKYYSLHRFECGPGTIYDPATEGCNHPKNTRRSECIGALESKNNEIDSAVAQEILTPIKIKLPDKKDHFVSVSTVNPFIISSEKTTSAIKFTKDTSSKYSIQSAKQKNEDNCMYDGFMGDRNNCRTFYRCVNNGRGGFIRYEFSCSETTIWDDEIQSCNHPSEVIRSRCGRSTDDQSKYLSPQDNFGAKLSIPQNNNKLHSTSQKLIQGDKSSIAQNHQHNQVSINKQDKNLIRNDVIDSKTENPKQTTKQFTQGYGSNDDGDDDIPQNNSENKPGEPQMSNDCTSSGFKSNPNDCKRFYRCVDNGNGGFTRYEFSCGEGTVWDPNIEGCNHAWAVKKCGNVAQTESVSSTSFAASTTETSKTTQRPQTTTTEDTSDESDTGYGNQNQESSSTNETPIPSPATTEYTQTEAVCTHDGLIGDSSDCKKFYRCVDNGRGSYTKYEFSCGEGTVWDPEIEACNHAWAVNRCGETSNNNTNKVETTTNTVGVQGTSETAVSNPQSDIDTDDNGYGLTESSTEPSSTTTKHTTITPQINENNVCKSSGFMGDSSDCKKFYRCVDDGKGGYIRYEFSCGEGTVWDQSIEACNHAWAVSKCGETLNNNTNKEETTTNTVGVQGTSETAVSNSQTDVDTDDNGYGLTESSTESSFTTTKQTTLSPQINENNVCKSSGFMGDASDCKKFYRCVDDGKGGYTRYEFSCGEGTVWDQSIEACNHAWAVKSCKNTENQNVQQTTSSSESITNGNDHQNMSSSISTSTTAEQHTTVTNGDETSTMKQPTHKFDCSKEGFYGDQNDCKKFYRCVENGKGGFTKYEFACGEGTIWDQEIQGCNHPSSSNKCGNDQSTSLTTKQPEHEQDEMQTMTTTLASTEITTTSSESSSTQPPPKQSTSQPQSTSSLCDSEGFYANPIDCKKFYRCVDNGKGVYTKYDFSCGDGTVWDQEILACNHETDSCKSSSNIDSTTAESQKTTELEQVGTQITTTDESPTISSTSNPGQCSSDGFYPDQNDCKKFYRCVDNGKGGYTKYDFTCGEGTVWVQEIQSCDHDNDLRNCAHKNASGNEQQSTSSTTNRPQTSDSTNQASTSLSPTTIQPEKETNENPNETTSSPSPTYSGRCKSEGFYSNEYDCRKFYRCVDNGHGEYTKYDFTCGEGTAWDSDIQACNHINEVKNCDSSDQSDTRPPVMQDEVTDTTESSTSTSTTSSSFPNKTTTTTTTSPPNNETKPNNRDDNCNEEGYFGNSQDCKKFYRCVDNGKGGFTKYDFDCGEGTIWDQDITACNHPRDVSNPSCKDGNSETTSSTTSTDNSQSHDQSTSTSTQSSSQSSSSTTESSSQGSSNCSQESSSKKPENKKVNCTKEGYYEDPDDCKKFYRCVDWDGNGEKFSVYHFECGDGTIWDPSLDTCNHEASVYPPRDCSGKETQSENEKTTTTTETSQEKTTTTQSSTTEMQSTTEKPQCSTEQESTTTEQQSTTTEQQSTTTEQQTTVQQTTQSSTSKETTKQESTTSDQTTTENSKEESTTHQSTTSEQTTTEKGKEEPTTKQTTSTETTTQQSTTQQTTTREQTTTEQSTTTEPTTLEQSNSTQSTSSETSTSEQSSTEQTQQTTTEKSSTSESTTSTSTQTSTTQKENESTTTENQETTTESNNETSSEKSCPETEDDQYLYVCPTGFRKHPKFCNMFYQCSENNETHELKIATFICPNNTIYDEKNSQCVEENKAEKKCDGQIAQKRRFKRLDANLNQPMVVNKQKHDCPTVGHFPFDKNDECSPSFLKCERAKSGKKRGFMYQCPENYVYWSVSRRCESKSKIRNCKKSVNNWSGRYEIPFEKNNVAS